MLSYFGCKGTKKNRVLGREIAITLLIKVKYKLFKCSFYTKVIVVSIICSNLAAEIR